MAIVKWNGGIELDVKSVIFLLSFAFAAGGGWMKLEAIERKLDAHLATVEPAIREHHELVERVRNNSQRLEACCPLGVRTP